MKRNKRDNLFIGSFLVLLAGHYLSIFAQTKDLNLIMAMFGTLIVLHRVGAGT